MRCYHKVHTQSKALRWRVSLHDRLQPILLLRTSVAPKYARGYSSLFHSLLTAIVAIKPPLTVSPFQSRPQKLDSTNVLLALIALSHYIFCFAATGDRKQDLVLESAAAIVRDLVRVSNLHPTINTLPTLASVGGSRDK